jgi:hypothetical protein
MIVRVRIYGEFYDFRRFWAAKNKANMSGRRNLPKPSPSPPWACLRQMHNNRDEAATHGKLKKQTQFAKWVLWH